MGLPVLMSKTLIQGDIPNYVVNKHWLSIPNFTFLAKLTTKGVGAG